MRLEDAHGLHQVAGLVAQRFGRRRRFFHQRCILLRDAIHLRHRLIDLLDSGGLFLAGHRDFSDDIADAGDTGDYL